jgi:para-nitrobenzyl esterase
MRWLSGLTFIWACSLSQTAACLAMDPDLGDGLGDGDGADFGVVGRGGAVAGARAGVGFTAVSRTVESSTVSVLHGELGGAALAGARGFLGVPYARPPVGDLRWKAPQEPDDWQEVRDATSPGPRCAQRASPLYNSAQSESEDCLYMNVWTPDKPAQKKLPVMVYIHGGDHRSGSASNVAASGQSGKADMVYDGAALAAKGLVVASFNYRLGVFGFLAHPALKMEKGATYGNQGLWDQTFALQWIHDNIASFGGDPNNVTIVGQGSGASRRSAKAAAARRISIRIKTS